MRFTFGLLAVLALISGPAMAADGAFYVGAGFGQFNSEINELDDLGFKFDEDDTGFKIFGGYEFLDWLGVEAGYIDGGEPSVSVSDPDLGSGKLEVGVDAITVAAVGILPIGDMFELYGKLGIAFWDGKIKASATGQICEDLELGETCSGSLDDDGQDLYYGLGAGVNIGENFNVRVEYEVLEVDPQGLDADASFLSGSVVYRF